MADPVAFPAEIRSAALWDQTHRVLLFATQVRHAYSTSKGIASRCRAYSHHPVYSHYMLTISNRVDVMNRLGRALADSTRSRILLSLLEKPGYPAQLARDLGLTRTNVSNHLACLRGCGIVVAEVEGRQTRYEIADPHLAAALIALVDVTLAIDNSAPCIDVSCTVPGCCTPKENP